MMQATAAKKAQEEAAAKAESEIVGDQPLRGLLQSDVHEDVGPIPQYPGRQLDPRGASSLLT